MLKHFRGNFLWEATSRLRHTANRTRLSYCFTMTARTNRDTYCLVYSHRLNIIRITSS